MSFMSVVEGFLETCEGDVKAFWVKIKPSVDALESEVGQILLTAAQQMVPIVEDALLGASGASKFVAASKLIIAVAEATGKKAGTDFATSTVNAAIETAVAALPAPVAVPTVTETLPETVATPAIPAAVSDAQKVV